MLAMAASLLAALLVDVGVTRAADTFTPDGAAAELTRLLAGERAAHGLPALAVDPFLAWVARDGPVPCPDGPIADGRAKDMALSGYFSHQLRLCPTYDVRLAFQSWGYTTYLGEIIAFNGGYDFSPFPYQFGCDVRQGNCTGVTTEAPTTVAMTSNQFMTSQGHRDVVLSSLYDRFACGAWEVPWSDYPGEFETYYTCLFAHGPGTGVVPSPTPSASDGPAPGPVEEPAPTKPTPTITPSPTATPTPTSPTNPAPTITPLVTRRSGGRERLAALVRDRAGLRVVLLVVDGHLRHRSWCHGASVCAPASWLKLSRGHHRITWTAVGVDGRSRTTSVRLRVR
jgi:uncharacterized protein YkwD